MKKLAKRTRKAKPPVPVAEHARPELHPVDQALYAAAQAKLIMLASRPLSPRSMMELERMTRLTHEMLSVGQDPRARHHHGGGGVMMQPYGGNWDTSGDSFYPGGGGVQMAPLASSSPAENFGATIVRELMALKGAANKTAPADALVEAIAKAKEKGLDALAKKLEKQLLKEIVAEAGQKEKLKPSPHPVHPVPMNGALA